MMPKSQNSLKLQKFVKICNPSIASYEQLLLLLCLFALFLVKNNQYLYTRTKLLPMKFLFLKSCLQLETIDNLKKKFDKKWLKNYRIF